MVLAELKESIRGPIYDLLDGAAQAFLHGKGEPRVDFSEPKGEAALVPTDSVSWRIFKNPVSLFIGGVTAVLLELAEPRVRSGVWDHTTFRTDPVRRLKRTGMAAMVTVYGARGLAQAMIAGVVRLHEKIEGTTPTGEPYRANDVELLNWVHATASYGFLEAYHAYVQPLSEGERDRYFAEGEASAALYGAIGAPKDRAEFWALFEKTAPRFERSDIIFEFLKIMKKAEAFPGLARYAQRPLIRAAVELVPQRAREALGLTRKYGLRPFEGRLVRRMGRRADRIVLKSAPPAQACLRMRLPADYLYRRR
jgi:uncharacterized protein (DUF2236 family)